MYIYLNYIYFENNILFNYAYYKNNILLIEVVLYEILKYKKLIKYFGVRLCVCDVYVHACIYDKYMSKFLYKSILLYS